VSETNLELVRAANAAFNRGDLDAWAEYFDPEVVFDDLNHGPDQSPVTQGLPALREIVTAWLQAMPDFCLDLGKLVAERDAVISQVTYRGTGKGSRLAVDLSMVDVSWWIEGKVTYYLSGLESLEEGRQAVAEDRQLQTR
jgi:predicted ester cyclase